MGSYNANLLPSTTGLTLGNINQQWTLYASNVFAGLMQSITPNAALSGAVRLANTDAIAWRNAANTADLSLSETGVAVGDLPADVLKYNGSGIQATLISSATTPATTGAVRLGPNDSIKFRNNADTADTAAVSMNASDQLVFSSLTTINGASLELGQNPAQDMQITQTTGTNGQRIQISPLNQPSSTLSAQLQLVPGALVDHSSQIASQLVMFNRTDGTNIEKFEMSAEQDQFVFATSAFGAGVLHGMSWRVGPLDNMAITAAGEPVFSPAGIEAARFVAGGGLSMTVPITKYKGIALVGNGVPSEVAVVNLIGQTAALATTTLYAVPSDGRYMLSWNAKVTTVAGTSSTLGPLTIVYTDPDGVVVTVTCGAQTVAGAIATSSAGNTTGTVLLGLPMLLNCKSGSAITYAFAYASNAANIMAFKIHIVLEAF